MSEDELSQRHKVKGNEYERRNKLSVLARPNDGHECPWKRIDQRFEAIELPQVLINILWTLSTDELLLLNDDVLGGLERVKSFLRDQLVEASAGQS